MTWANARACAPVWSGFSAHCAANLATAGSSAAPKTICSCLRLSRTVARPSMPMEIAATPKTTSTTPAMMPPISNSFLMSCLPWFAL